MCVGVVGVCFLLGFSVVCNESDVRAARELGCGVHMGRFNSFQRTSTRAKSTPALLLFYVDIVSIVTMVRMLGMNALQLCWMSEKVRWHAAHVSVHERA